MMTTRRRRTIAAALLLISGAYSFATTAAPTSQPTTAPASNVYTLPPTIVTAEKRPEPLKDVPVSVTNIDSQTVRDDRILDLRDATELAPNVIFSTFAPPRESFPFIRGIGSGQNSPAVTTYYDGVPQLSFSTADIELYDIDRIEFLRGPQGTLYGRNTLGGVINVYHREPDNDFHVDTDFEAGNYALQDYRGAVSGPIVRDKLFYDVSGGFLQRNGYSINLTDHEPLDGRNHLFGRAEILWKPTDQLDIKFMINGEQDHDGDFPIYDLGDLHESPRRVEHDFTGFADRTLDQEAIVATYHGEDMDLTSVSAYQEWRSDEVTDLDESPLDLLRRYNSGSEHNLIEEFRLSSPNNKPIEFSPNAKLKWLAGIFAFRQDDDSSIGNETRPELAMELGSPVGFTSYTDSNILNYGVGIFGDTTLTLWDKLDLTAGLRYDYEDAHGNVDNFSNPAVTGSTSQTGSKDFDDLSPRFAVGYHWSKDLMTYAEASHGYKVGGFNSTAPTNAFAFGPEKSWDYELGVKSTWLDDRLQLNADLFYIDWRDMQLDVPTGEPSVFYTANVGSSDSRGAELEGSYRITRDWQLFGGIGYTDALFRHYTQTNGVSADGNRLPFAPEITWNAGTQYNLNLQHGFKAWARAEVIGIGHYFYDASNAARQDTYIITNFRVGVGKDHWRLEGFINNAFNSHYFPIAYPFQLAASGYVGESGAPQTMGIDLGFSY